MRDSHDLLITISEEDVQYILEDHFDEECHKATYDVKCKNCGKKCQMSPSPKLSLNAKGDILIDGFCSNCQKPLLSTIVTSNRIDWNEYAMVVRETRVVYQARTIGNHKSDKIQHVPSADKYQDSQSLDNEESLSQS